MIEFQNISKSFASKKIINNISGKFYTGKINMIIGKSGTGKSILLKNILGIITPDLGEVFFNKKNFFELSFHEKTEMKKKIGVLFQGGALFDAKTVAENVRLPLDFFTKMSLKEKNKRVDQCLNEVGLEYTHNKIPAELSGGMKKRVGIARAIINNPEYLFCDEPNAGLDPQTSSMIDELIQKITHTYKITTIIITHDMNAVFSIGEHFLFLHEGIKAWEGPKKNILDSDIKTLNEFIFAGNIMQVYKQSLQKK